MVLITLMTRFLECFYVRIRFWSCRLQIVTNLMFFIGFVGNLKRASISRSPNMNFSMSGFYF